MAKAKVKVVGYLDGIISTALFITTFYCYLRPMYTGEPAEVDGQAFIFWSLFLVCILFEIVSILAAITLVLSTGPNVSVQRAIEMVRFWMQCNGFTIIVLTCLWLVNSWLIIPMLVYLLFRFVFVIMISKEFQMMNPRLTYTAPPMEPKSDDKLEERWVGGFPVPFPVKAMVPAREPQSFDLGPELGLGIYRGTGLSTPKCKCLNPNVDV